MNRKEVTWDEYVAKIIREKGEDDARRACDNIQYSVALDAKKLFERALKLAKAPA